MRFPRPHPSFAVSTLGAHTPHPGYLPLPPLLKSSGQNAPEQPVLSALLSPAVSGPGGLGQVAVGLPFLA